MKKTFTIQEISELLGIPKSTLRYWESQELITPARNTANKYREYSLVSIYELSEIMLYKNLQMPMKELKNLYQLTPQQLSYFLDENKENLDREIKRLQQAKNDIILKKQRFLKYKEVEEHPYQITTPDITALYPFHFEDKSYWQLCYEDSYYYTLYRDKHSHTFVPVCILPEQPVDLAPIWQQNHASYAECIIRCDFTNSSINNCQEHINTLRKQGYQTGDIIARHLFTAWDQTRIDYFLGWIEISQ